MRVRAGLNLIRRLARYAVACLALLLPACAASEGFSVLGYSTKPNYNTDIRTVRVPIFKNYTFRQGLEFDLTREVINQIQEFTPYRVVSGQQDADTELLGVIRVANKSVINRNQLNEVREAETVLAVELIWRDTRTGEVLSRPRKEYEERLPDLRTPAAPSLTPGEVAPELVLPAPEEMPLIPGQPVAPVVVAQSLAHFIPELGGSITTSYQQNVQRLATQIVSMMETSWCADE